MVLSGFCQLLQVQDLVAAWLSPVVLTYWPVRLLSSGTCVFFPDGLTWLLLIQHAYLKQLLIGLCSYSDLSGLPSPAQNILDAWSLLFKSFLVKRG